MTPEPDPRLINSLAALDATLAAGTPAGSQPPPNLPPDQLRVYQLAREGLLRLERAWPRAGAATPADAPTFDLLAGVGRFGKYLLSRELGRGGGGVVFLATDTTSGRQVALKLPHLEALLDADLRDRFLQEAGITVGLEHPALIPVLEAGEVGGLCYIASAYCGDVTLAGWLESRAEAVPVRTAAALVAALAKGVDHLHENHVLHRDVKPSNVLVQAALATAMPDPELAACGVPRLTDFGLAKRLGTAAPDGATGGTTDGLALGTVEYMAPEQADGRTELVARPADVYALGAVLYELLAGQPPFRGRNKFDTIRKVLTEPPPRLRRLRPDVPRDLEAVCLKCLEKDPKRRYSTAAQLGDDLQRFLAGQPTAARPVPGWCQAWRWVRRRPGWAVLTAVAVAAPVVLVLGLAWYQRGVEGARADELRTALFSTDAAKLPSVVVRLRSSITDVEHDLGEIAATPDRSADDRLRAALVVAPSDSRAADYLRERLLTASAAEVGWICEALAGRSAECAPDWSAAVRSPDAAEPGRRLRAACALAQSCPDDGALADHAAEVADSLLAEPPETVLGWAELLRPCGHRLVPRLSAVYTDPNRPADRPDAQRATAAAVLAEFCPRDTANLVRWVETADDPSFRLLVAKLRAQAQASAALSDRLTELTSAADVGTEDIARRRANLALALLLTGDGQPVRDGLRDAEPRYRFRLIHQMAARQVSVAQVGELLNCADDDAGRYAALLALGEYDPKAVPGGIWENVGRLYRDDPDSGVHSAAEWLLTRWGPRPEPVSAEQAAGKRRRWFTTPEGYTLAVVKPTDAAAPPFAIATTEVTVAQFRRFAADMVANGDVTAGHYSQDLFSEARQGDPRLPVKDVSFIDAALYCNWLSAKEGLKLCYDITRAAKLVDMSVTRFQPDQSGYRLPSEAEWELACRAGAMTPRFYGEDVRLLPKYAWFFDNAAGKTHEVGSLRPNPLGLFDIYGNVSEWCWNAKYNPRDQMQVLRGGNWQHQAPAAMFDSPVPATEYFLSSTTGFRIARNTTLDGFARGRPVGDGSTGDRIAPDVRSEVGRPHPPTRTR